MKTAKKKVIAYADDMSGGREDELVIESPLDVLINGSLAYCCMRMPGMDAELAAGLCYGDGRLAGVDHIIRMVREGDNRINLEMVESGAHDSEELKIVCGAVGVMGGVEGEHEDEFRFTPQALLDIQRDFFTRQEVFMKTGATHAAALYDRDGDLLAFAEDVGRHNALDKCIGRLLLGKRLHDAYFCMLSSRISCEMVERGCRSGARVIAGVSAPTSLAVRVARENAVTLIGFLRGERFNVYTGESRVIIA